MLVPNRHANTPEYRYGFNGMEMDDEVKGEGNSYDFGSRMHDSRVGRFFSRDPKWREYIFQSLYVFAANGPMRFIDFLGEGPGDRILAAKKHLGTKYLQQTNENELRTGTSKEALEFMDCSELICRVLAADEFTSRIESKATSDNSLQNWFKTNWKEVDKPKKGDMIIWKGHTALVTADYEEGKQISVIHATKYQKSNGDWVESVVEEKYNMSYYEKKGAMFYTPLNDKPDGDLDGSAKTVEIKSKIIIPNYEYPVIVRDNLQLNLNVPKIINLPKISETERLIKRNFFEGPPTGTVKRGADKPNP